jgi:hypothetical protein
MRLAGHHQRGGYEFRLSDSCLICQARWGCSRSQSANQRDISQHPPWLPRTSCPPDGPRMSVAFVARVITASRLFVSRWRNEPRRICSAQETIQRGSTDSRRFKELRMPLRLRHPKGRGFSCHSEPPSPTAHISPGTLSSVSFRSRPVMSFATSTSERRQRLDQARHIVRISIWAASSQARRQSVPGSARRTRRRPRISGRPLNPSCFLPPRPPPRTRHSGRRLS